VYVALCTFVTALRFLNAEQSSWAHIRVPLTILVLFLASLQSVF
jgi:hypothetical protein